MTIARRSASRRSASRAASGMPNTRTSDGTATMRPISAASMPLAFSHTGKNGIWMPEKTKIPI